MMETTDGCTPRPIADLSVCRRSDGHRGFVDQRKDRFLVLLRELAIFNLVVHRPEPSRNARHQWLTEHTRDLCEAFQMLETGSRTWLRVAFGGKRDCTMSTVSLTGA